MKDAEGFKALYGNRSWFVIGEALMKVVLPIENYQVQNNGAYEWDDLGWFAYQEDLGRYPDLASDDGRRRQSLFEFYREGEKAFGYTPGKAATYAMNRIGFLEHESRQLDRQLFLELDAEIERTRKTVPA